jgi:hypothetical protein
MLFGAKYPAVFQITEVNAAGSRIKLPIKKRKKRTRENDGFVYPKYVAFFPPSEGDDDCCAMRRINKREYWRDAGAWGCNAKIVDGKLLVSTRQKDFNNRPLYKVTEEVWRKSNGQYVPGYDKDMEK